MFWALFRLDKIIFELGSCKSVGGGGQFNLLMAMVCVRFSTCCSAPLRLGSEAEHHTGKAAMTELQRIRSNAIWPLPCARRSLVVAEGIETALSLLSGVIVNPSTVWSALSTIGMRGLILHDMPG
ncbi:hypothetical protein ACN2XU_23380 [Primorskyibacter sp. 2E107]|uniref:hypothetical protein n=1 Tax=Primorskyibacter sp. 2E107 TaxID=3403458 RepID=UPI003AF7C045